MAMATCQLCEAKGEESPFSVPWDFIGEALMEDHFKDKHPEVELVKEQKNWI